MANGKMDAHSGRSIAWPILGVVIGIASCGSPETNPGSTTPTTKLTWNDDIGPLVHTHCGTCHYPGGSGHFDLLNYESTKNWAPSASAAMNAGRMPPWPPASDCHEYTGARTLPAGVVEKFDEWVAGGMPVGEGAAKSFTPRLLDKLRADLTAKMTEAYTPNASLTDDYRCFVLDLDFPADTWVEGVDVTPGTPQVHHVLTYAVGGSELSAAMKADTDEAGSGYTCFGGPVPGASTGAGATNAGKFPILVGAWVPGFQAQPTPQGSAILVPAGNRLVMQVHYNTDTGNPAPDGTSLTMQTRASAPAFLSRMVPLAQLDLKINAGDPASQHTMTMTNWGSSPTTIAGVAGHMHNLGKHFRTSVLHTSNKEECMLDIPDWDFQWQMQYNFTQTSYVMVQPGDSVRLECTYDNSAENQPVVGGVKQQPKDVTWGEGTLDEMCLMYLSVITPLPVPEPAPTTPCGGADACIQACNPKSASCLVSCEKVSTECMGCAFDALLGCGGLACGLSISAAKQCVVSCATGVNAFGGAMKDCLSAECPSEWSALTTCLDPFFSAPACSTALSACGI